MTLVKFNTKAVRFSPSWCRLIFGVASARCCSMEHRPVHVWYTWRVNPNLVKLVSLVAAAATLIYLETSPIESKQFGQVYPKVTKKSKDQKGLNQVQYEIIEDVEVVWETPQDPRALLLLAHGCNHRATDFWDKSSTCTLCKALPEEKKIVRAAIERGYVSIAVTSENRMTGCWNSRKGASDSQRVVRALQVLRARERWADLPMFALGASSGGGFVAALPHSLQLQGIAMLIMGIRHEILRPPFFKNSLVYPPTIFIHMPRDKGMARIVLENVKELKKSGVPTLALEAHPIPMKPFFFSDRLEGVKVPQSVLAIEKLMREGVIDGEGFLTENPRSSHWRTFIQHMEVAWSDSLDPDASPISEEMNVAFAQHEMTGEFMPEILDFFDTKGDADLLDQLPGFEGGHPLAFQLRRPY